MRAFTACLLALCLAQGAMAAKKQQVTFSPPPPPGAQDFIAPGVSLPLVVEGGAAALRRRQTPSPNRVTPPPQTKRPADGLLLHHPRLHRRHLHPDPG